MKDTKTFIVSDTWFNRSIFTKQLGVDTVEEYNTKLIEYWNSIVSKNDKVYVLGGFGIGYLYEIVMSLNGEIVFLDNSFSDEMREYIIKLQNDIQSSIDESLKKRIYFLPSQIITIPDLDLVLSYLPLKTWYGKKTGTVHMFGYDIETKSYFDVVDETYFVNCMASKWNFKPVRLSDIDKLKNNLKKM